jgi:hypothetical protein
MVEVLAWSIRRNTRRQVEVHPIGERFPEGMPMPQKPENRPATPFSFQRFAVPQLAGYRGRAIYADSDQLVLRDIGELFDRRMYGMRLQCRARSGPDGRTGGHASSVMLLDCEKLDWSPERINRDLDDGRYSYKGLMALKPIWRKGRFPRHWNSLDHHEPGVTGLLHYTKRATQPWLVRDHAHGHLWFEALYSGLDAGAVSQAAIDFSLEHGFVRPSLRWQVERRLLVVEQVPAELKAADEAFFQHCSKNQFNNLDGDYRAS